MCSGVSASGDLPKWRANSETCWRYDACVWGDRLRSCISSVIRCRRTVMGSSFATWKRCNKQRLMMSQSDLSKMQYDGLAPTIATRQLPRSGFVQSILCGAPHKADIGTAWPKRSTEGRDY